MYQNLCGAYRGPDVPSKKEEAYKPYKATIREHDGVQFIIYHYNTKGQEESIKKVRKQVFKEAVNWI